MDDQQSVGLWNYKIRESGKFFSEMRPEQERLQPVPWNVHYEWDETSMFGFNIPEHGIDCIIYYWHHPTMKTVYGGIMIWQGLNENQLSCAYSDYRLAMPMPLDITDCTYANGVRVKMIEPMKEFDISFDDEARNTHLRLKLKAIMPPACRYNNNHITQAMKTSGELVLNGKRFSIAPGTNAAMSHIFRCPPSTGRSVSSMRPSRSITSRTTIDVTVRNGAACFRLTATITTCCGDIFGRTPRSTASFRWTRRPSTLGTHSARNEWKR